MSKSPASSSTTSSLTSWLTSPLALILGSSAVSSAVTYAVLMSCRKSSSPSSSVKPPSRSDNVYETDESLNEYLLMHFGTSNESLAWMTDAKISHLPLSALDYPKRCADFIIDFVKTHPIASPASSSSSSSISRSPSSYRVLDLGCAVGRASFELSRFFEEVVGVDYSHSFIAAANDLKAYGHKKYSYRIEGDYRFYGDAVLPASVRPAKVNFFQGDACALDCNALGGIFDVIMCANLLCRLYSPRLFLSSISSSVSLGGYLILFSPYTWLSSFTPKEEWIGGREGKRSAEELKEIMEGKGVWKLVEEGDSPFLIRETARKHQWTVAHRTVWQKLK